LANVVSSTTTQTNFRGLVRIWYRASLGGWSFTSPTNLIKIEKIELFCIIYRKDNYRKLIEEGSSQDGIRLLLPSFCNIMLVDDSYIKLINTESLIEKVKDKYSFCENNGKFNMKFLDVVDFNLRKKSSAFRRG
jgi:hypothetical protein